MREVQETGIELLLSEPEIVAWLDLPGEAADDDAPSAFAPGEQE